MASLERPRGIDIDGWRRKYKVNIRSRGKMLWMTERKIEKLEKGDKK